MKKSSILKKFFIALTISVIFLNMIIIKCFAIVITSKGTLKVSNIEAGVKVTLYKLTSTNYNDEVNQIMYPPYEWEEAVKTYLEGTKGKEIDYSEYADSKIFAQNVETNSSEASAFYDLIASAIKGGEIQLKVEQEKEASGVLAFPVETNSEVEFTELDLGTYLVIIENGYMLYRPSIVNIIPEFNEETEEWQMSKSEIQAKAGNIGIEKTVNEETGDNKVSLTDIINFDIRADVPQYLETSLAKKYCISDKLSKGLTLIEDSLKVYGVNGTAETLLIQDEQYEVLNKRPNDFGESTFTLNFDYEKIKIYEKIHIDYNVKLNQDETTILAGEGNPNNAYMDYSNNPYDEKSWKTQEDKEIVYTYELSITKVDRDNHDVVLIGAEFILSENKDGTNPIKFIKKGDGIYYKSNEKEATTNLVVGNEGENAGKLILKGLDNKTYYLLETKAPNEYNKLPASKELTINNDNVKYIIENIKKFQLPFTGGRGTIIFPIVGSTFILAGLILIIVIYKKSYK